MSFEEIRKIVQLTLHVLGDSRATSTGLVDTITNAVVREQAKAAQSPEPGSAAAPASEQPAAAPAAQPPTPQELLDEAENMLGMPISFADDPTAGEDQESNTGSPLADLTRGFMGFDESDPVQKALDRMIADHKSGADHAMDTAVEAAAHAENQARAQRIAALTQEAERLRAQSQNFNVFVRNEGLSELIGELRAGTQDDQQLGQQLDNALMLSVLDNGGQSVEMSLELDALLATFFTSLAIRMAGSDEDQKLLSSAVLDMIADAPESGIFKVGDQLRLTVTVGDDLDVLSDWAQDLGHTGEQFAQVLAKAETMAADRVLIEVDPQHVSQMHNVLNAFVPQTTEASVAHQRLRRQLNKLNAQVTRMQSGASLRQVESSYAPSWDYEDEDYDEYEDDYYGF